jgi:23S rRNA pseudouridine1911/1915/1917 synthase
LPSASPKPSELPEEKRLLDADEPLVGLRLDKALAERLPDLSRSRLAALIDAGSVLLNGVRPKPSTKLRFGDRLQVSIPPAVPSTLAPEPGDLKILFEDETLLVVAKAAGVVVHPGAGTATGTLAAALLAHCGALSQIGGVMRPGIVHRLDKGTSGLLVVAKNDQAHRALSAQFKGRLVTKIYSAICLGTPRPARGSIRLSIGRDPLHRQRMAIVADGRAAHTDYEVTEVLPAASVVRLTLHTGRTHQIRVHLAALKCPLVGDRTYGAAPVAERAAVSLRDLLTRFPRPALHAEVLGFTHPVTGEAMRFEEPWPEDLVALRDGLRSAAPPTLEGGRR